MKSRLHKTYRRNRPRAVLVLGLSLFFSLMYAQEIDFRVNAPQNVVVGQQFRIVFTVNAEGSQFTGPDFKGFSMLSGPNASSSSNIQIINGQVTSSFTYSYTYILLADQEGTFQVGPAKISIAGKDYQTKPFQIRVSPGQASQQRPAGTQQPAQSTSPPTEGVNKEDVFFRASVDKSTPYQDQQVIITYRIYTRVQINLPGGLQQPPLKGFWTEDLLKNQTAYQQTRETIDGQEYVVVEYKKLAIFPQRSGKITIEPFEIQVNARVQSRRGRTGDPFFDQFFGGSMFSTFNNVSVTIRSNPITLDVKPLPSAGKPGDFSGAVGKYQFSAEANPLELKTNDAINIKYTIRGNGNLRLIDKLNVSFPPDFETYDPKVNDNLSYSAGGISGSRTFEYLTIPRAPGSHTIKPVVFSYFDPEAGRYVSLTADEFRFEVEKGSQETASPSYSGVSQEDIRYIGSDIRFIRTTYHSLSRVDVILFGSQKYWIFITLPLLLFILFIILWRRRIRLLADKSRQRNRKASRLAKSRLKASRKMLETTDQQKFYETLATGIWGYVSDKLGIPRANLSIEYADELLSTQGVEESSRLALRDVLNDCEFRRYAPSSLDEGRQELLNKALTIITDLENTLKK